jgi:hypothetical protein
MLQLVDVEQSDIDVITRSLGLWQCSERWALGGLTPSPEMWGQLFYQDVAMQRAIRSDEGGCAGLLQLVRVNADDGFAHLELFIDPLHAPKIDNPVAELVDQAFEILPLRKLLLAAAKDHLELPACLATTVQRIGSLRDHRRRGRDVYVSVNLYELWVDDWSDARAS